ncbi:stage III sporulation protein AG [Bacillus carboniphilus]|uniref:Stage III sporulation protein AG n=1 Tax=Bacillus carboniphilus TaxID=86663 RepID=A0ABY9JZG3_9BACI|nr:stage III sporulation protein AG [Bacillus carboniphilus]WLR43888.1 stage III sporulation protein AG [Bacillus carboniphilus]
MKNKVSNFFESLKNGFHKTEGEKNKKVSYLLIVLLIGILFMSINLANSEDQNQDSSIAESAKKKTTQVPSERAVAEEQEIFQYEKTYEEQLKKMLEEISGVEDVSVMVNVDSTYSKVLEKNRISQNQTTKETDREGGERQVDDQTNEEQVVIIRQGDGEEPVVIRMEKPTISGVLVVARGVENIAIERMVIEAVTRALDVPSHRVAVQPKN